jgi:hypothetical protein
MTRDEAEKETQELQTNLKQYKEVIKERDRQLKEKDKQAEELRQEGQRSFSFCFCSKGHPYRLCFFLFREQFAY